MARESLKIPQHYCIALRYLFMFLRSFCIIGIPITRESRVFCLILTKIKFAHIANLNLLIGYLS